MFLYKIPRFILLFLSIFTTGCNHIYEKSEKISIVEDIGSIELYNYQKKSVGHAVRLETSLYLSPDHLLEKNNKKLFYKNRSEDFLPISIKMRDFSHDLLFFEIKERPNNDIFPIIFPEKKSKSFNVKKQELFYKNPHKKEITYTKTYRVKNTEEIRIEYLLMNNLWEIPGNFTAGDSGLPFWDKNGDFQGILIASNIEKNLSYVLPVSQIFEIYETSYKYTRD